MWKHVKKKSTMRWTCVNWKRKLNLSYLWTEITNKKTNWIIFFIVIEFHFDVRWDTVVTSKTVKCMQILYARWSHSILFSFSFSRPFSCPVKETLVCLSICFSSWKINKFIYSKELTSYFAFNKLMYSHCHYIRALAKRALHAILLSSFSSRLFNSIPIAKINIHTLHSKFVYVCGLLFFFSFIACLLWPRCGFLNWLQYIEYFEALKTRVRIQSLSRMSIFAGAGMSKIVDFNVFNKNKKYLLFRYNF